LIAVAEAVGTGSLDLLARAICAQSSQFHDPASAPDDRLVLALSRPAEGAH
jgi:hypothetical protein